ncbi:hypothetical protein CapIbe_017980 [Capra ibex]
MQSALLWTWSPIPAGTFRQRVSVALQPAQLLQARPEILSGSCLQLRIVRLKIPEMTQPAELQWKLHDELVFWKDASPGPWPDNQWLLELQQNSSCRDFSGCMAGLL